MSLTSFLKATSLLHRYKFNGPILGKENAVLGSLISKPGVKPLLNKGSKVGITFDTVAEDCGYKISSKFLAEVSVFVTNLGLEPVVIENNFDKKYLRWNGTPESRAQEVITLIEKKSVDAIWPLFGKGGASTTINTLHEWGYTPTKKIVNLGAFSHHTDCGLIGSKWFKGQISTTQLAYHATQLTAQENTTALKDVLFNSHGAVYNGIKPLNLKAKDQEIIDGKLAGGNSGVMIANSQKEWFPNFANKILFVEQFNLDPHEMHRQLTFMTEIAIKDKASAVFLGRIMTNKNPDGSRTDGEVIHIIQDIANMCDKSGIPLYQSNNFGHGYHNMPLGIGSVASIFKDGSGDFNLFTSFENYHQSNVIGEGAIE